MSVIVVIPTYNEKESLSILVEKIFSLRGPDLKIIVVDDNSPDGTGELAENLAKKYPIEAIHREKKMGLGTAYVEAFKKILSKMPEADYVIQMDADFSHDPVVIPRMFEKMGNCDLVLGSRYVIGGGVENWDFFRRLISRLGNFYARLVLGLPYKDLTGGFKCFRRNVLENLNLGSLSSVGYNFQIETTYRAYQKGYRVCEIPIIFTERKAGVSKFNFGIILESFWRVILLKFRP